MEVVALELNLVLVTLDLVLNHFGNGHMHQAPLLPEVLHLALSLHVHIFSENLEVLYFFLAELLDQLQLGLLVGVIQNLQNLLLFLKVEVTCLIELGVVVLLLIQCRHLADELILFDLSLLVRNLQIILVGCHNLVLIHLLLQSLELAVVIQSVWELLHQIFEHAVWNAFGCNQLVDLDVETMEELVLLHDLLQLGLIDAQLLHEFILQAFLPLVNVLECHLILHALVVFLIDDQLHERLVGYSVLVIVFTNDPNGFLQILLL